MPKMIMLVLAVSFLTACSQKYEDLKSPCVGAAGSPCDRRPVNDWWNKA